MFTLRFNCFDLLLVLIFVLSKEFVKLKQFLLCFFRRHVKSLSVLPYRYKTAFLIASYAIVLFEHYQQHWQLPETLPQ